MGKRHSAAAAAAVAAIGLLIGRDLARFAVAEESMAPALLPGDYLITRRLRQPPRRGEVVVFTHPARAGFHLIKRIVAVGGESVEVADGQVIVNGRPLAEPWANGPTLGVGRWQLAPEEAFVLGDARSLSADDGRTLGPLAVSAIEWRAIFRYWPPTRLGRPAV